MDEATKVTNWQMGNAPGAPGVDDEVITALKELLDDATENEASRVSRWQMNQQASRTKAAKAEDDAEHAAMVARFLTRFKEGLARLPVSGWRERTKDVK